MEKETYEELSRLYNSALALVTEYNKLAIEKNTSTRIGVLVSSADSEAYDSLFYDNDDETKDNETNKKDWESQVRGHGCYYSVNMPGANYYWKPSGLNC